MRGRPRKPSALKLLEGNWRPDTAPKNEPRPEIEIPEMPEGISEIAQNEWNRITPELERLGLLGRIDRLALAMYCEAYATSVYARQMVSLPTSEGGGMVIDGRSSPWLKIWERASAMVLRFAVEFGMTPASRSRINVLTEDGSSGKKHGAKDSKNFA
jgi:P27 family predicted phage terminase small subunit